MSVKVLVVEDHDAVREGLVALLGRERDLEVVGGLRTAEVALILLDRVAVDVVVMDYALPGMDGAAGCRLLGDHPRAPAVVIHSGHLSARVVRRCLEKGALTCVPKGGDPAELVEAIRRAAAWACLGDGEAGAGSWCAGAECVE